jgi:hypothetical protein
VSTDSDVRDDQQWFADHPGRQYRLRRGWAVRRHSRVFLRAPIAASSSVTYPDDEGQAEAIWWRSAWSELPPETRNKLMMDARRKGKPR